MAAAQELDVFEVDHLKKHWPPSSSMMESLKKLTADGLLPAPELKVWRPPLKDHMIPYPNNGEIVVFEDFVLGGLGLLVHGFLKDLCIYWGISICNLDPNSILTVLIFIAYCEAYLGILPHFSLFRHFTV